MVMLGAAIAWGTAGVASASTAGRQSVPPPVATPLPPGGFSTIVTTQTITPAGGTIGPVAVDGAEVTIHVPAAAFPADVQIVITASDLAAVPRTRGFTVVAGVGVGVSIDGVPYPGTFLKAITVDISSPKIDASSMVGTWNGSAFVTDPSSAVSAGMATISMDSDAAFIVQSPLAPRPAPVPSATTPVTGEPFLGEGILAGLLVLGGTGGIALSRRRRVSAGSAAPARELSPPKAAWVSHRGCPRPSSPAREVKQPGGNQCSDQERGLALPARSSWR